MTEEVRLLHELIDELIEDNNRLSFTLERNEWRWRAAVAAAPQHDEPEYRNGRSAYMVVSGVRGGESWTETQPVNVPQALVRGQYEKLSDLQLREAVNDLLAELERRSTNEPLAVEIRRRLEDSTSHWTPEPITQPSAMSDSSGEGRDEQFPLRPTRRQIRFDPYGMLFPKGDAHSNEDFECCD